MDDRISDGQLVQIDQCMCCTRFEPVYGQVYECLNDLGANVAAILDDNQMSYSNMEDYINMNRVEKYNDGKEDATINLDTIQNKDTNDKILKDRWGAGLKMNWKLTAKEDQHPHINWRQSINDDGSSLSKLPTYPCNESNTGQNVVNGKQETRNNSTSRLSQSEIMQKNYDAITNFNGQGNGLTEANIKQIQTWIANAQSYAKGNKDVATTDTQNNAISMAEKYTGTDNTISSSVIVCLNVVTNKGIENTYNEYKKIKSELDTTNPGLIICAMFCGTDLIKELINNAQKTDKDSGGIGQAPGEGVSNIPSSAEQWTIDMCMITSKKTGIPVDWIWAQFCNESGNFKSPCAQHNYGGMSSTSGGWMTFESPTAFGEYMGKVLPRWVGSDGKSTTQAKTMYEYVVALQTDPSPYCASPAGVEPYYAVLKSILGNEGTVVKDKRSTTLT